MVLYENLAAFELASGNIHVASEIFRSMVTIEASFVDGWLLLLTLYFKHSPMDVVVKIAEDAIHKCEHDVAVVFIYSKWLNEKVIYKFETSPFFFILCYTLGDAIYTLPPLILATLRKKLVLIIYRPDLMISNKKRTLFPDLLIGIVQKPGKA